MKTKRKLSHCNKLPVSKAKYAKVERAVRNYLKIAKACGWGSGERESLAFDRLLGALGEAVS